MSHKLLAIIILFFVMITSCNSIKFYLSEVDEVQYEFVKGKFMLCDLLIQDDICHLTLKPIKNSNKSKYKLMYKAIDTSIVNLEKYEVGKIYTINMASIFERKVQDMELVSPRQNAYRNVKEINGINFYVDGNYKMYVQDLYIIRGVISN